MDRRLGLPPDSHEGLPVRDFELRRLQLDSETDDIDAATSASQLINGPEFFGLYPGDDGYESFDLDFPSGDPAIPAPYDLEDHKFDHTV